MLLAYFSIYLAKNITYGVVKNISFHLGIMLRVEILKDWGFDKYFP